MVLTLFKEHPPPGQVGTEVNCIRISVRTSSILTEVYRYFPHSVQANGGTLFLLDHGRVLPDPFHITRNGFDAYSLVKGPNEKEPIKSESSLPYMCIAFNPVKTEFFLNNKERSSNEETGF
jgi:hypothetical protein